MTPLIGVALFDIFAGGKDQIMVNGEGLSSSECGMLKKAKLEKSLVSLQTDQKRPKNRLSSDTVGCAGGG